MCRYLDWHKAYFKHLAAQDEDHLQQEHEISAAIHTEEMIDRGLLPKELDNRPNY